MLKTRIVTAVILVAGLLAAVFLAPREVWNLLMLGIALIGVAEWGGLLKQTRAQKWVYVSISLCVGLLIVYMPQSSFSIYQAQIELTLLGVATFFWVIIAPVWLITRKTFNSMLVMSLFGIVLIFATWIGLVGLHDISPWLLLGLIAAVSIADSAAYFAGKCFGRHKLAPEISPGKTWEGVAGALFAVTVYGVALCYYKQFNPWVIVGLWLLVVLSIMGDLVESLLKRQAGLKDSGQLLPGHGGVLDRIDGLIPALPITLLCIYLPLFTRLNVHG